MLQCWSHDQNIGTIYFYRHKHVYHHRIRPRDTRPEHIVERVVIAFRRCPNQSARTITAAITKSCVAHSGQQPEARFLLISTRNRICFRSSTATTFSYASLPHKERSTQLLWLSKTPIDSSTSFSHLPATAAWDSTLPIWRTHDLVCAYQPEKQEAQPWLAAKGFGYIHTYTFETDAANSASLISASLEVISFSQTSIS